MLAIRNRLSRCDMAELCRELFGSRICTGGSHAVLTPTADALQHPYQRLQSAIRRVGLLALPLGTSPRREVLLLSGAGFALTVAVDATAGLSCRYLLPAIPPLARGGPLAWRDVVAVSAKLPARAKQKLASRFAARIRVTTGQPRRHRSRPQRASEEEPMLDSAQAGAWRRGES